MIPAATPPVEVQVTEWTHPDDMCPTQWGNICFGYWLEKEIRRWRDKDFRNGYVRMSDDGSGKVAMFSDDPAMVAMEQEAA